LTSDDVASRYELLLAGERVYDLQGHREAQETDDRDLQAGVYGQRSQVCQRQGDCDLGIKEIHYG
jgi:hypothetical protein